MLDRGGVIDGVFAAASEPGLWREALSRAVDHLGLADIVLIVRDDRWVPARVPYGAIRALPLEAIALVPFVAMDGVGQGGVGQGGVAMDGVGQGGVGQGGVAMDGVGQGGVAMDGVAMDGVAMDGVAMDGVGQDGVGQGGAADGLPAAFVAALMTPYGLQHALVRVAGAGQPAGIELVALRLAGQPGFDAGDRERIDGLLALVWRSVQMQIRLRRVEADRGALDHVSFGVMAVTGTGRVISTNRAADLVVRRGDGIGVRDGMLVLDDPVAMLALQSRLADAVGPAAHGGAVLVRGAGGGGRLSLAILPLPRRPADTAAGPSAVIFIGDLDRAPALSGRRLVDLFGLTAAEARLAVRIGAGVRLEAIAGEREVQVSTLRSQLQGIFAKTGTRRQGDIVALVLRLSEASPV